MIQAAMLIALGFLLASLIGVLLAPSLWARAARLSRKKLESSLPLTLSEIEAAQDQLRASYAVRMRRLETALAGAKQKAANQLVDNSRLQMEIAAHKDRIAELELQLSERRNAATVLEQQITKRFPELDGEITRAKAELQERGFELQDLTNRLLRREEDLDAAKREAASYQAELGRLREVLERSSQADKGSRRLRRASQWGLDDYKAEYDRLNLELSKLRQQLSQLQDRDAQQVGVIKGELQKLAELIMVSGQPRPEPQPVQAQALPQRPKVRRAAIISEPRGEGARLPRPLPQGKPTSLTARLQLNGDGQEQRSSQAGHVASDPTAANGVAISAPIASARDEAAERGEDLANSSQDVVANTLGNLVLNGSGSHNHAPQSAPAEPAREAAALPVLSSLVEETMLTERKNGASDVHARPSLLKDVVAESASSEPGASAESALAVAESEAGKAEAEPANGAASAPIKNGKAVSGIEIDDAALTVAALAAVNGGSHPAPAKAGEAAHADTAAPHPIGPYFSPSDKNAGSLTLVERMRVAADEPAEAEK